MTTLTIATNAVRRLVRDRAQLFFVFVFPLLLVLLLGSAFGGDVTYELAVAGPTDGRTSGEIVERLRDSDRIEVVILGDHDTARTRVARGRSQAAVLLPPGFDDDVASGRPVDVAFVAGNDPASQLLRAPVAAVLDEVGAVLTAASVAVELTGADRQAAAERAQQLRPLVSGPSVSVRTVGTADDEVLSEYEDVGAFALLTHQQLVLFTFLTSLTAASSLIQSRQLGVARRMLATPASVGAILVGEATGRFLVALVQALYLVVGTAVLFGVEWGKPLAWFPLIAGFSLVSAAAGMLMGSVFRNDSQASGLGIFFGLALAAIGGCMLPLELFSPTMRTVAHVTPHAWALDAFRDLVAAGGGVGDVVNEVAVLVGYGLALLAIGTVALRRALLRSV